MTIYALFNQVDNDKEIINQFPIYPTGAIVSETRTFLQDAGINISGLTRDLLNQTEYPLLSINHPFSRELLGWWRKNKLGELQSIMRPDRKSWVEKILQSLLEISISIEDSYLAKQSCDQINKVILETHLYQYRPETHKAYYGNISRLERLTKNYWEYMPYMRGTNPIVPQPGKYLPEFWRILTKK